jgi:hypothetical protein
MFGWPDEECKPDLYKQYYEASKRSDEWAEVDKAEIRKQIEEQEEANSYQGGA